MAILGCPPLEAPRPAPSSHTLLRRRLHLPQGHFRSTAPLGAAGDGAWELVATAGRAVTESTIVTIAPVPLTESPPLTGAGCAAKASPDGSAVIVDCGAASLTGPLDRPEVTADLHLTGAFYAEAPLASGRLVDAAALPPPPPEAVAGDDEGNDEEEEEETEGMEALGGASEAAGGDDDADDDSEAVGMDALAGAPDAAPASGDDDEDSVGMEALCASGDCAAKGSKAGSGSKAADAKAAGAAAAAAAGAKKREVAKHAARKATAKAHKKASAKRVAAAAAAAPEAAAGGGGPAGPRCSSGSGSDCACEAGWAGSSCVRVSRGHCRRARLQPLSPAAACSDTGIALLLSLSPPSCRALAGLHAPNNSSHPPQTHIPAVRVCARVRRPDRAASIHV